MKAIVVTFLSMILFFADNYGQKHSSSSYPKSKSFYTKQLMDSDAVYFTPENFNIKADGSMDVSDVLQQSLYDMKTTHNFGILFLPEGKYLISKTIYVPQAHSHYWLWNKSSIDCIKEKFTRLSTTGFYDKGKAKYMFWFIHSVPKPGEPVRDAGAGTFYSAMSNIDLEIDDGNPYAVALRTHYAQHSFIAHVDIHINNGMAGMFDVGNEMEDVKFLAGSTVSIQQSLRRVGNS